MTPGQAVEPSTGGALAGVDPEVLAALRAQQDAEITSDLITTPILKLAQSMTREVQDEDNEIEAGEFFNSLTGEALGTVVEFIPAYYQTGRFAVDREENRSYVAFGETIPESWSDLVGEEYVGTPFANHPDAEETYKIRVNRKEIKWGKGPLISTTHNFTGYVLTGSEDEPEYQPVRLSLQRTQVPAAKKWLTMARAKRNTMLFDYLYTLSTKLEKFDKGSSYLLVVKQTRPTEDEEKLLGVELATATAAGRTQDNQADAAKGSEAVEPAAAGGAEI
jgi:hypothetical protein